MLGLWRSMSNVGISIQTHTFLKAAHGSKGLNLHILHIPF